MRKFFDIDDRLLTLGEEVEAELRPAFARIESNAFQNQQKVLAAFIHNNVGENCFTSSTGYGYGDVGRDKLERVFADAMECEDALLRHNFMCGTHALTVALFGVLRPGDTMLCVTGMPYDTIQSVIGISKDGLSPAFARLFPAPLAHRGADRGNLRRRAFRQAGGHHHGG